MTDDLEPDREAAIAFYKEGFKLIAAPQHVGQRLQYKAWLAREAQAEKVYGKALEPLLALAQAEYEAETGLGALSGEPIQDQGVDNDF